MSYSMCQCADKLIAGNLIEGVAVAIYYVLTVGIDWGFVTFLDSHFCSYYGVYAVLISIINRSYQVTKKINI